MGFLLVGLILTALENMIGGLTLRDYTHGHWGYWFVWPHVVVSLTIAVAATVGFIRQARRETLYVATFACILAPLLAVFAATQWPGGDDGPGGAWLLLVIPASVLAALWGWMFLVARPSTQISVHGRRKHPR